MHFFHLVCFVKSISSNPHSFSSSASSILHFFSSTLFESERSFATYNFFILHLNWFYIPSNMQDNNKRHVYTNQQICACWHVHKHTTTTNFFSLPIYCYCKNNDNVIMIILMPTLSTQYTHFMTHMKWECSLEKNKQVGKIVLELLDHHLKLTVHRPSQFSLSIFIFFFLMMLILSHFVSCVCNNNTTQVIIWMQMSCIGRQVDSRCKSSMFKELRSLKKNCHII